MIVRYYSKCEYEIGKEFDYYYEYFSILYYTTSITYKP